MTTINITNNTGPINNYPSTYIPTKVCKSCRIIKQLTEFYKEKSKHDGYQTQCKNCKKTRDKEYYDENKDDILKNKQEYYKQNKDDIFKHQQEYYKQNKDEILKYRHEYYKQNKDEILEYRKNHKDSIRNQKNEYIKNKRNTNPIFRLIENNRHRIRDALKSNSKTAHSIDLLGCSKEFFFN